MSILLKIIATVCTAGVIGTYGDYRDVIWNNTSDETRQTLSMEIQAHACGMTVEEFEYIARVVEAESDRTSNIEGKILIAATILNRVGSGQFPNTIRGVLDQDIQFTTTENGWCSTPYTLTSRWAIVEAQRQLTAGEIPDDLLFFNCIGYQYGTPYAYVGGNYFSCA